MAWPRADGDWAPYLSEIRACYRGLLREITARVPVLLLVDDLPAATEELGAELASPALRLHPSPAQDTWTRDYGPITVLERSGEEGAERPLLLDFVFNGWGGKYGSGGDNAASQALHARGVFASTAMESVSFVLEGGSIETDGQGTLLTTSTCLLTTTRNPDFQQQQLELELRAHLGIDRVLWLDVPPLAGDDTDAHIDTLVRFCPDDTLAYAPGDPSIRRQLEAMRTRSGEPYRLVPLPPGPSRQAWDDGRPLPATYANALFLNGTVLVPLYGDSGLDQAACASWAEACPGWEIAGVDCSALLLQHGSLHCATMQLPAAVFRDGP